MRESEPILKKMRNVEEIDGLIRFPDSVCILATDIQNNVVLVRQFRESRNGYTLELPGGKIEMGESISQAANRELLEETGILSENTRVIISLDMDFSKSVHRTHVTQAKCSNYKLQTGDKIVPIKLPLSEALKKIESGEISHAATVVGLRWLETDQMESKK